MLSTKIQKTDGLIAKMCIVEYVRSLGNIDDDAKYYKIFEAKDKLNPKNIDGAFKDFKDVDVVLKLLQLFKVDEPSTIEQKKIPTVRINGKEMAITDVTNRRFDSFLNDYTYALGFRCHANGSYSICVHINGWEAGYSTNNINGERIILIASAVLMIDNNWRISTVRGIRRVLNTKYIDTSND